MVGQKRIAPESEYSVRNPETDYRKTEDENQPVRSIMGCLFFASMCLQLFSVVRFNLHKVLIMIWQHQAYDTSQCVFLPDSWTALGRNKSNAGAQWNVLVGCDLRPIPVDRKAKTCALGGAVFKQFLPLGRWSDFMVRFMKNQDIFFVTGLLSDAD